MNRKMKRVRGSNDQGIALILVLLAVLVLTTLAAAMVFSARSETLASYNYRISTQAEFVARAGIQKAINFFNSSSYAPLPSTVVGSSPAYYDVSTYAVKPLFLYYSNYSVATCPANCTGSGGVVLGTSASSSNYPPSTVTLDALGNQVNVVTNWVTAMNAQTMSDGMGGTGSFTVTARLLDYHTVNDAFYGFPAASCTSDTSGNASVGICRKVYETWEVTSTGTWNSNLGAAGVSPTVEMKATIAPMYVPYFGNALYGLCSVRLNGNACTDSYVSDAAAYDNGSGTYNGCASPTNAGSNAAAANAGIGANGGLIISGSANTVGGNASFASTPPAGCTTTGFTGTTTGIAGSVLAAPPMPAPPTLTMTGYPTSTPTIVPTASCSPGNCDYKVVNVYTKWTSGAPSLPPGIGSGSCANNANGGYIESYGVKVVGSTNTYYSYSCQPIPLGNGSQTTPYLLGDLIAGTTGNNGGNINFIGPPGSFTDPIHIWMNSIDIGNSGAIYTSSQPPSYPVGSAFDPVPPAPVNNSTATPFSMAVYNSVDMGGGSTVRLNFNPGTPGLPGPDFLRMYINGSGDVLTMSGQPQLNAVITIPNGNAVLSGSGSGGTMFGSILANNITDNGHFPVHYDLSIKTESGKLNPSQLVSMTRPKY